MATLINLAPGEASRAQAARWEALPDAREIEIVGEGCPGCGQVAHAICLASLDPCPVAGILRIGMRWDPAGHDEFVTALDERDRCRAEQLDHQAEQLHRRDHRGEPLAYPCPSCKRGKGETCISGTGRERAPHQPRRDLAAKGLPPKEPRPERAAGQLSLFDDGVA